MSRLPVDSFLHPKQKAKIGNFEPHSMESSQDEYSGESRELEVENHQKMPSPEVVKKRKRRSYWRRKWQGIDIIIASTVLSVHLLCLSALFHFNWAAVRLAFLNYVVGAIGITLSYHRNLAHRSFKLPKWLEYFFGYCGLLALQGHPIDWVSTHRYHHQFTDSDRDPHSPIEGFWFSHMIWIFDTVYIREKFGRPTNVGDLKRQWYYRFLQKTMGLHVLALATILYLWGGLPFLAWGVGVPVVLGYHVTWLVNSACHKWGTRVWKTNDSSHNIWWLSIFSFGESWHNNHHAFESSARQGLEWWQIDITWYIIRFLEKIGLATDVKLPTESQKRRMALSQIALSSQTLSRSHFREAKGPGLENYRRTPSSEVVMRRKRKAFWGRKWRQWDIIRASTILIVHLLCLVAPFQFNCKAVLLAFAVYMVAGLGITVSFHRNLAHRSFKLPKWLEYFFAYCGLLALQGDPIDWVSTHRYHHQFTDSDRDPHSPIEGFWFSHLLWAFDTGYVIEKCGRRTNVGDLKQQWYYRFLQRTVVFHIIAFGVLLYLWGGLPFIAWGMGIAVASEYHVTWLINSACHIWGTRAWKTNDTSRNTWWLSIFSFGESWHNNHHAFESSARQGLEWWQIDISWYIIRFLETIGLATDAKLPSDAQRRRMALIH